MKWRRKKKVRMRKGAKGILKVEQRGPLEKLCTCIESTPHINLLVTAVVVAPRPLNRHAEKPSKGAEEEERERGRKGRWEKRDRVGREGGRRDGRGAPALKTPSTLPRRLLLPLPLVLSCLPSFLTCNRHRYRRYFFRPRVVVFHWFVVVLLF
jgi:hypothetical protein